MKKLTMTDYPPDELAARRDRLTEKEKTTMSNYDYEMREAREYTNQMTGVEKAPLHDRKEAAAEFFDAMKNRPGTVGERIGWLLDGNYGYGAMKAAKRVLAMSKRANKRAQLVHMVGALEWQSPVRMTIASWKKLSQAEKDALDREVDAAMADASAE